jgi:hypothetical protein
MPNSPFNRVRIQLPFPERPWTVESFPEEKRHSSFSAFSPSLLWMLSRSNYSSLESRLMVLSTLFNPSAWSSLVSSIPPSPFWPPHLSALRYRRYMIQPYLHHPTISAPSHLISINSISLYGYNLGITLWLQPRNHSMATT